MQPDFAYLHVVVGSVWQTLAMAIKKQGGYAGRFSDTFANDSTLRERQIFVLRCDWCSSLGQTLKKLRWHGAWNRWTFVSQLFFMLY